MTDTRASTGRLDTLDLVRGAAMVLMAIDHVRVYAGVPPGGPTPGVFFTRWVTHLVAPAFVFLAGTAAFLHGRRVGDRRALAQFLAVRGVWLIVLELTVLRMAWTFNVAFGEYLLAGVIWMIGWCMLAMAALVSLSPVTIGLVGLAIVCGHNLIDLAAEPLQSMFGAAGPPWLLKLVYFGGVVQVGPGGPPLFVLFVLVPWVGVMMMGYAFGLVMSWPDDSRRRFCLGWGTAACVAFVLLRALDVYGDPRPWRASPLPLWLAFLNTTKYPASLLFLLMTLGPVVVAVGLSERWRGPAARVLVTFGRVPLFYYLLHIPVIHAAALVVSLVREGRVNPWLFGNHPMNPPRVPDGYMWSLSLLYVVVAACVIVLYVPCRAFARRRAAHPAPWMRYL